VVSRTAAVKERLAAEATPEQTQQNSGTVVRRDPAGDLLSSMEPEFAKALPNILPIDTFLRIALTCMRKTPRLIECTRPSLLGALMECARLGLQPGTEQATLTPFRKRTDNGFITEVQLIIGYQGYIELMYRSGMVQRVENELVHEADKFELSFGDGGRFFHEPAWRLPKSERGDIIATYAYAEMTGGGRSRVALTPRWEAEEMRDKFGRVWKSDFVPMWRKTPIRQLQKYVPKSSELRRALDVDGATIDLGGAVTRPEGLDDMVDGEVLETSAPQTEAAAESQPWPETAKPADAT
jgi:recombination protein RecT